MSERFLLDANLSPITREFPESTFNLDVTDLLSLSLGYLTDLDVVELARREGRIIVTLDLDFGEIYHQRAGGDLGVIIVRLADQTVESVNRVLERFFRTEAASIPLDRSLVVVEAHRVRIRIDPQPRLTRLRS